MKYFKMLASFYSVQALRDEVESLAIVVGAVVIGGLFVWRVTRFMKKEDAEDLERERQDHTIP